ncbi:hypothetical protein [Bacillus thuringiensis]|uniref:Uncharacterized protein n=1 Tax=Bacillus thuringiensis TaxID=1428 RepID=A0ABD6SGA5_BACTU|nr:hypothetical protein [Bacillus thuringiensis]PEX44013.1 hypothetical protein CN461_27995 [Bacillus thuringiensis]PFN84556.1 hypothetical protein COJ76_21595 [Bacillus thuringiensis]PGO19973.1 hypothetical protein CN974_08585 [Bacillus thuringiensis]
MRLEIEDWTLRKNLSDHVSELLTESIICYKAGAYRASYIFSYLSFLNIVRDKILSSKKPDHVEQGKWKDIQDRLLNDNEWDAEVHKCMMVQKENTKVFELDDDIRSQVTYWRYRRNDCAHYKRNKIGNVHVEAFWFFIMSNIDHFVVIGSSQSLYNLIRNHFDISFTPSGKDPKYIIEVIENTIKESNYKAFLKNTKSIIEEAVVGGYYEHNDDVHNFYNSLFDINNTKFKEELMESIKQDVTLVTWFIYMYPQNIIYFKNDKSFIRKYWHEYIFNIPPVERVEVFSRFLIFNLISEDEIREALLHIMFDIDVKDFENEIYFKVYKDKQFFTLLKEQLFGKGNNEPLIEDIDWLNRNYSYLLFYIEKFELNKDEVLQVYNLFTEDRSFKLLREIFEENKEVKLKFEFLIKKYNIKTQREKDEMNLLT